MMRRNGATLRQNEITSEVDDNKESLVDIESLNKSISSERRTRNFDSGSDSQTNYVSATGAKLRARVPTIDRGRLECCIFRVANKQREQHEDAYTPWVVSVGPYHRKMERTRGMEEHKLRYLQNFLTSKHNDKELKDYLEVVRALEEKARCYYDELPANIESEEFIEMMVVDGIFIIQLLLLQHNKNGRLLHNQWLLADVRRDLALLENQLPFFLIECLFDTAFGSHSPCLIELACEFFRPVMGSDHALVRCPVRHLLDAIRLSYSPETRQQQEMGPAAGEEIVTDEKFSRYISFCSATNMKLSRAVRLQKSESKCLLDIKLDHGVLEIPRLTLRPTFESLLRNMLVFEHNCCQHDIFLTEYISFLCQLVTSPEDAKVLIDEGIIQNWLGNYEAAANVLNSFGDLTIFNTRNFYLVMLLKEFPAERLGYFHQCMIILRMKYFRDPWTTLHFIWMMLLLTLTFIQAFCSVYSVPGLRRHF